MPRTRRTLFFFITLALLVLFPPVEPAPARMIGDVNMPETLSYNDHDLVLNGVGWRKKWFFKIYAGGLFLNHHESNPEAIINADEPMGVRMHFVFKKLAREKVTNMLHESFEIATNGNLEPIKENMHTLFSQLPETIHRGDIIDLVYLPERGIVCYINGKYKGESPGLVFKKAVFTIWLGPKPINEDLKEAMLGLDD